MKKDRICRIFLYSIYELDALKDYLEGMALKGWMLEKVKGNSFFYFKSSSPQKLKYSIEVLNKASQMDVKENKRNSDYIYYCETAGWRFITSQGKIQIFCTDRDDVPPIESDYELKLKELKKCVIQQELLYIFLLSLSLAILAAGVTFLLPITLMNYWFCTIHLYNFMITPCCIYKAITYRLWFKRAKASIKSCKPIKFYGTKHRNSWIYAVAVLTIAWFLFGIVYYALYYTSFWWIFASISFTLICTVVYKLLLHKMPCASYSSPKGVPLILVAVVCLTLSCLAITMKISSITCSAPLTFDAVGVETDYGFTSGCEHAGNFLVQRVEAYDHYGDSWSRNDYGDFDHPYMHYEIYKTSLPWLQEIIIQDFFIKPMSGLDIKEIEAASFRADKVYYISYGDSSINTYILKYAGGVVRLNVNFGKIEGELAARVSDCLSGGKLFVGDNEDI